MYKKLLFPILYLFAFSSYAQTFEWLAATTLDFNMNPDMIGYNLASDPSGNLYMTGFKGNAFVYEDIMGTQYYRKYNANGFVVFSKEIWGNVNIYNIATDAAGNLVMMLGYVQNISIGTLELISINQGVNYMMVKFNPEGNILWYHEFYLADSSVSGARALAFDTENNIYVGYDDYMHSYIEKISPEGTILSTITQQHVRTITSLSVDNMGNIYAAGSCADPGATFGNAPAPLPEGLTYNVYVAKYAPTAVFQWVKYLDNVTCPLPQVKAKTPEEVYLTSQLFDAYNFDSLATEGPLSGQQDTFIAKLNATGNFQWVREVPGSGSLISGNRNILSLDAEGNIYFAGQTSGTVNWSNTIATTTAGFGNRDAIVLKYNSSGEILMAKSFGGENEDRVDGITIGTDGSILVAGLVSGNADFDNFSIEADVNEYHFFLGKITNETLKNPDIDGLSIGLYPNPSSDYIYLNATGIIRGSIFNVMGQKVKDFEISNNQRISVNELAEGTYIVKPDGKKALKFIKS